MTLQGALLPWRPGSTCLGWLAVDVGINERQGALDLQGGNASGGQANCQPEHCSMFIALPTDALSAQTLPAQPTNPNARSVALPTRMLLSGTM